MEHGPAIATDTAQGIQPLKDTTLSPPLVDLPLAEPGSCSDLPFGFGSLRPREQRFVLSFVVHGQPRRAALDAGYSPKNASWIACHLRRRSDVKAVIEQYMFRSGNDAESRLRNTFHLAELYNIELEAAREERIVAEVEGATSEHLERLVLKEERLLQNTLNLTKTALAASGRMPDGARGSTTVNNTTIVSTGQDAIEPSLLKALAQARLDGVLSADPGEGSGN
jgi:phage terminase small subunit